MRLYSLALAALLSLSACTSDKRDTIIASPPSREPAEAVLELHPREATREAMFYVRCGSVDLANADIRWFINDKIVEGAASSEFGSQDIRKGDRIRACVIAEGKEIASNQVAVDNIRPTIVSAKISPSHPKANDALKADVTGNDRDGDEVTIFYEWLKNGEDAGKWETLDGPFKRGDRVSVQIIPFDGEAYGRPLLLTTDIRNSPPNVAESGSAGFQNEVYTYQVRAADRDGDTLIYSLKSAPHGMTINPSTGLIVWNVPPDSGGRASFTVSVTDGCGGETLQSLRLDVSAK